MVSVIFPDSPQPWVEVLQEIPDVEVIFVNKSEAHNRAERLNLGVQRAQGQMILLHHPRSRVDPSAIAYLVKNQDQKIWGGLTHQFDNPHSLLKFTSWYSNHVRAKFFRILYLDHCVFFHRSLWRSPIPDVPIFEDTLLSYQLRSFGPPRILPFVAMTSAVRFEERGVVRQTLVNQVLKLGFHLGVSTEKLNNWYERTLKLNS